MTVKEARDHAEKIKKLCTEFNEFDNRHEDLNDELRFFEDALQYLCNYRKILEIAIDKAELVSLDPYNYQPYPPAIETRRPVERQEM